jgi:hypothetical protein
VDEAVEDEVNPPPEDVRVATFVLREGLAVAFVGVWLLLFAGELVTAAYVIPFWFHCVAVGVLGYALGINVSTLVVYRKPTARQVTRAVVQRRRDEE